MQSKFTFLGTELDVSFSYTKSNYNNPGYDFPFVQGIATGIVNPNTLIYADPAYLINLVGADNPAYFSMTNLDKTNNFLNDNSYDTKVDYNIPFKLSDSFSGKISVGGKYHKFDRNNYGNSIYFLMDFGDYPASIYFLKWFQQNVDPNASGRTAIGVSGLNFMDAHYTPPTFLNGRYKLDTWGYDMGLLRWIGENYYNYNGIQYWGDGPQSFNNIYDETEKLAAGYVMTELKIGSNLTVILGVRYEELKGEYGAYAVYTNNSSQNGLQGKAPIWRVIPATHINYFPSVNVQYNATENIQLMGSYYSSAARPDFSALSSLIDYSVNGIIASSNPFLKPAIAQNFELGISVSSNTLGLFTVNGFYKEISDLIYTMPFYMLDNTYMSCPRLLLPNL